MLSCVKGWDPSYVRVWEKIDNIIDWKFVYRPCLDKWITDSGLIAVARDAVPAYIHPRSQSGYRGWCYNRLVPSQGWQGKSACGVAHLFLAAVRACEGCATDGYYAATNVAQYARQEDRRNDHRT